MKQCTEAVLHWQRHPYASTHRCCSSPASAEILLLICRRCLQTGWWPRTQFQACLQRLLAALARHARTILYQLPSPMGLPFRAPHSR